MARMTTRVGGVAAVVVLCLGLAACQGGDDASGATHLSDSSSPTASPSVSPSPSVQPSEAAIAERAAEAEKRHREYVKITEQHRKNGTHAYQELFDGGYLGNPEMWAAAEADDELFAAEKLKQVGKTRIASIEVTGYDGDPLADGIGGHRVKFAVCLDYSDYDVVREDGDSAIAPDQAERVLMKLVLQGQQGKEDRSWAVSKYDAAGKEC